MPASVFHSLACNRLNNISSSLFEISSHTLSLHWLERCFLVCFSPNFRSDYSLSMGWQLHGTHGHSHGGGGGHGHNENINVRAAFIHVLGDFLQSIGVFCAAVVVYFKPEWRLADPICTFIFSVIVLYTTVTILKDAVLVSCKYCRGAPRIIWFLLVLPDPKTFSNLWICCCYKLLHSVQQLEFRVNDWNGLISSFSCLSFFSYVPLN